MESVKVQKTLKSGKQVEMAPLDSKTELHAAKAAGGGTGFAGQLAFLNECVKMTIRSIDGQPVDYTSLDLDEAFTMKEIRELREFFNQINIEDDSPLEDGVVTVG